MSELMIIKQLPIIEERLETLKVQITGRVESALAMEVTEDTVKEVKAIRAELNKEVAFYEGKRMEIKKAVLQPYEAFESIYKRCVGEQYKEADRKLKSKIDAVEDGLKDVKAQEVCAYFEEYAELMKIDFLRFEQTGINITLSASMKSLKEQAVAFIDRVVDDLEMINTQEHEAEILVEYRQTLNAAQAIATVNNRRKAIEAQKATKAQNEQSQSQETERVDQIAKFAPPVVEDEKFTVSFKVTATKDKLRELKKFLNEGGYDYE